MTKKVLRILYEFFKNLKEMELKIYFTANKKNLASTHSTFYNAHFS